MQQDKTAAQITRSIITFFFLWFFSSGALFHLYMISCFYFMTPCSLRNTAAECVCVWGGGQACCCLVINHPHETPICRHNLYSYFLVNSSTWRTCSLILAGMLGLPFPRPLHCLFLEISLLNYVMLSLYVAFLFGISSWTWSAPWHTRF